MVRIKNEVEGGAVGGMISIKLATCSRSYPYLTNFIWYSPWSIKTSLLVIFVSAIEGWKEINSKYIYAYKVQSWEETLEYELEIKFANLWVQWNNTYIDSRLTIAYLLERD